MGPTAPAEGQRAAQNDQGGFSVEYDHTTGTVRLTGWGFWMPSVTQGVGPALVDACRNARRPFKLLVDFTKFLPQGPDGQEALRSVMSAANAVGLSCAVVAIDHAVSKLQLIRIAHLVKAPKSVRFLYVRTIDEAVEALFASKAATVKGTDR